MNERGTVAPAAGGAVVQVIAALVGAFAIAFASSALASQLRATPGHYREAVRQLQPGDTLWLAPGVYRRGLDIHRLVGTLAAPIVIRGVRVPSTVVFTATPGRNTISIVDSAYVKISDIDLVGDAAVDAIKAEGTAEFAHDITLERLRITGHGASQQNVAISTKCPAWNWIIRDNVIDGAGTGIYLGNSDGSAPFARGLIEGNVISGTRGYSMQIKHQLRWPSMPGLTRQIGETVIRYNTFAKDQRSTSGESARPNLLLGHWPLSGPGSGDRYLVYGNLFFDNPHETLLQAEGNVTLYNNVFVNRFGDGVAIREHNDVPRQIDAFRNTIVVRGTGLLLRGGDSRFGQIASSNAIFAAQVVPSELVYENVVHRFGTAGELLRGVAFDPRSIDLAPKRGLLVDPHWWADNRQGLPDLHLDFDRKIRRTPTVGAYAGSGPARRERFIAVSGILK